MDNEAQRIRKDVEEIYQQAMAKGCLNVALKAKELLGREHGLFRYKSPEKETTIEDLSDEVLSRVIGLIEKQLSEKQLKLDQDSEGALNTESSGKLSDHNEKKLNEKGKKTMKTMIATTLMAILPMMAIADVGKTVQTPSGLSYIDTKVGEGATPKTGQTVVVHYTGRLKQNDQKFDSSVDRGEPFKFQIGKAQVIPGWDEGVATMKVGGKRQLIVPADLAYGATGVPGAIPPNSTLVFDVELLKVE